MTINEAHPGHPTFAMILKERVVEQFLIRLDVVSHRVEELLLVSPVLGTLSGTRMTMERLQHVLRLGMRRNPLHAGPLLHGEERKYRQYRWGL